MDLHIALDEIKRSDGHVSETTAEDSTGSTSSVEGRRVHLDLLGGLGRSRDDETLGLRDGVDIGVEAGGGGRGGVKHLLEAKGFGGGRGVEEARDQRVTGGFLREIHGGEIWEREGSGSD